MMENFGPTAFIEHEEDNPIFFRDFIEYFVRACMIKSRDIVNVGEFCQKYIKKHVLMIAKEEKIPKGLLPDQEHFAEQFLTLDPAIEQKLEEFVFYLKQKSRTSPFPNFKTYITSGEVASLLRVI